MNLFWPQCDDWLSARGYKLYPRKRLESSSIGVSWRWYIPARSTSAPYPFATCSRKDGSKAYINPLPLRIAFAQDLRGRDVVIKLVNLDTDEHHIYEELLHCDELLNPGAGVLPPVAILRTPFRYSFVVMPRWGPVGYLSHFETVADVMHFMRCTLQGLVLLHSHRIAHRDIFNNNILVDYYSHDVFADEIGPVLAEYRRTHKVYYSLFDFNLSIKLPPSTSLRDCLRPAREAMTTCSPYEPPDVALGEYAYNPFAFDVACLGNMFMVNFNAVVSVVPLLAPLFDKMTTPLVRQRFTAQEALEFLESIGARLPPDSCTASITLEPDWECQNNATGYWTKTPPGFSELWSPYKIPSPGWYRRLLMRLCTLPIGWQIVRIVRALLRV
ncbi:hypothetical protein PYCCODRAFT_1374017 [Trametes coccinea BRFM310]|uniref:Protein kinase domain-containing protein n=1 Tax=Trametes coccinea (strain BRFM310) TaxID=1353009 RepID=A0A1Y2IFB4_TRAC3|nr:hypothetical protein PYCCODRAFT_1374017 [Trametes coccinea BRFM310]